eukprot:TRINITY_DN12241_c0_g1_i1.p1 TRINITY_DN12241_c0_g1~~TRINITY_DN12241_c0_g1_i1.p1  ORF type:complete len:254 (+),score=83.90 TRINITY_DN12241_c0_g1_i1:58-819(+)
MAEAKYKIVLVRHGESVWNQQNLFTGWTDVDLSDKGVTEAHAGGKALKEAGYEFDICFTSYLKRAIKTLAIIQETTDQLWVPVVRSWRLNERHYGSLQGLNKAETAEKYGDEQVLIWRRAYDIAPPPLSEEDPTFPGQQRPYKSLTPEQLPKTECLKDTVARVLPFWESDIAPAITSGKKVIVVAHGNSLRALIKYLDNISDNDIISLNLPTGIPLVYELDADLKPIKHYYLADEEVVKAALSAVANQGKAKQ